MGFKFLPNERVPLIQFLYMPMIPEQAYKLGIEPIKIGGKFPNGIVGQLLQTDIGDMIFAFDGTHWALTYDVRNPPIRIISEEPVIDTSSDKFKAALELIKRDTTNQTIHNVRAFATAVLDHDHIDKAQLDDCDSVLDILFGKPHQPYKGIE